MTDASDAALRRIEVLEDEKRELVAAVYTYRLALEHYLNMAVAAGADPGPALEALAKLPKVKVPLKLVRL